MLRTWSTYSTGTFSRTLAPSIRAAYLILPEPLLEEYRRRFPRTY